MNLSSDTRFEAYVEDVVATARVWLPPSKDGGDPVLPALLIGAAGITVANKLLNQGAADILALDSLGAAALAALACLCWLCERRGKPARNHAVGPTRSSNRPTYDESIGDPGSAESVDLPLVRKWGTLWTRH